MLKFFKRLFVKIFGLDKPLSINDFLYEEEKCCDTEEEWIYEHNKAGMW